MERTIGSILLWFDEQVRSKAPIEPVKWVEAGLFLNTLIGEEYALLAKLESDVSKLEMEALTTSKSATEAKMKTKASDVWLEKRRKELHIKQIEEFIRLSKKYGQLASDEAKHGI